MKKFLSLVLALAMTLSLVTISAGAKDFADSDELSGEQYEEAVNVMSEMGIIDGYAGGDFQPQGTLTRGAAAKIIACMMLGKTTAEALGTQAAPVQGRACRFHLRRLHRLLRGGRPDRRLCRRHLPSPEHPDRLRLPEDAADRSGL